MFEVDTQPFKVTSGRADGQGQLSRSNRGAAMHGRTRNRALRPRPAAARRRLEARHRWRRPAACGGVAFAITLAALAAIHRRLERRISAAALRAADKRYRDLVDSAREGVWMVDTHNRTTFANRAVAEMLGCRPEELLGRLVSDFMEPAEAADAMRFFARRPEGVGEQLELRLRGQDGREIWTLVSVTPIVRHDGEYAGALAFVSDISERKQMELRLQRLVDEDPLTGIHNRRRLIGELDRQLRYAARSRRPGAVLTLDLDNFKFANDTYGHATGDAMLRAVAEVLSTRARDTDVVARLGGDEFAVLLPEATATQALTVARDIRVLLGEHAVGPPLVASVGIATFTGTEEVTADEVLACADIALYEAKEDGGDQARVYAGQASGALSSVERIRAAIAEERFVLYGRPIVDLRSGTAIHHELLVRMVGEHGGLIEPSAFLPTAERFGLVQAIDRWVTVEGLRLARAGQRVAIVLSGHSIGHEPILAAVREAVAGGVAPAGVMFSIGEAAAMTNIGAARAFTAELNGLGCSVALSDFGKGFGSFTLVRHVPARYLKIDIDFMRDLATNRSDRSLLRAIIGIAHSLGTLTIAAGVEDERALALVRTIGVDFAQGAHVGPVVRLSPPTAAEARAQLSSTRAATS
jgi:diguanylate cyclase (GGDEF)-like protein/PAS domain S-box-containing protein